MTTQTFYRTVTKTSHRHDRAVVERATAAVLHALRDRLTMNEADQVFAQLPEDLKVVWASGQGAVREPIKMDATPRRARPRTSWRSCRRI
jgi:uncharacterized protein (DUF2267 family)